VGDQKEAMDTRGKEKAPRKGRKPDKKKIRLLEQQKREKRSPFRDGINKGKHSHLLWGGGGPVAQEFYSSILVRRDQGSFYL